MTFNITRKVIKWFNVLLQIPLVKMNEHNARIILLGALIKRKCSSEAQQPWRQIRVFMNVVHKCFEVLDAFKMSKKCGIAGCNINYNLENKCRVFIVPKNAAERHKWLDVLPVTLCVTTSSWILVTDSSSAKDVGILILP